MSIVLCIAPHPDDETLGCGGTLLKHRANGDEVYWLLMTKAQEGSGYDTEWIARRQEEIVRVAERYGFADTITLDFLTTELDSIPFKKIIDGVSQSIKSIQPEIIYLPSRFDVHSDHRITFDAVMSATKTFRVPGLKKVMEYEVVSETEFAPPGSGFIPHVFSDISDQFDEKISIMEIYESEMGEFPFPRSAENLAALATFRGATAGVRKAEGFMVIKELI